MAKNHERRTPKAERRTPNADRRTPNAERRTTTDERASSHILRVYSIRCIASIAKFMQFGTPLKERVFLPLNRQLTASCPIEPGIDASTIPLSKRKRFSAK